MKPKILLLIFSLTLLISCKESSRKGNYLFTTLDASTTGLHFTNTLKPTPDFNMLKYMYYFNGAGVGVGDFNNDGKIDLFFASNQGQNSLYINEGNMHFKEVTKEAKIPVDSSWSTGVSVVDINNDGMLDIYICRVGKYKTLTGKNQLLVCKRIVNGVPEYADETDLYGLGFSGFSTQACFFDFDNDGDLDMFLLNHSVNHDGNFMPRKNFVNTYDSLAGDQFFRNDGGHFTNITHQCGINSTKIGYGLGIGISDINLDGYPDIYVGNDFHENDYLYINQKDGTFKEELNDHIMHTSQFSMGLDIADINNDAYPDIMTNDMMPYDPTILKRSLAEDDYQTFKSKLEYGYNHQYSRNNLQLNQRNGMFSEVAFYSGVYATDWSWSSLWMDFDNDGKKDLFVSNGIPKRLNDIDYVNYMIDDAVQDKIQNNQLDDHDLSLIEKFPEIKLPNRFFRNTGDAKFDDVSDAVENSPNSFSNGAAYADFDNDGDLDVVVNNIGDFPLVYKNNTVSHRHAVNLTLKGAPNNINAIGAKCYVFSRKELFSYEKFPVRGFLSSMEVPLHITWGEHPIDSVLLVWPDNSYAHIRLDSNTIQQQVQWQKGLPPFNYKEIIQWNPPACKPFQDVTAATQLNWVHQENVFNEFNRENLMPKMMGTEGPALAVGDINGDGLEDVFIGSSKGKHSRIFVQQVNGTFSVSNQPSINQDSTFEDIDACFVDVNNDHFPDLVIASGGNEYYANERWMQPRLYLNDGKGNFQLSEQAFQGIFGTQSCIKPFDFNNDGFIDFFIGGRATPFNYGEVPESFLLQNDGTGHFKKVTDNIAKGLSRIGMVTNAVWVDINHDHQQDLVLTLEWGGIISYINQKGIFTQQILTDKKGWWNFVLPVDIDGDGNIDFICGNQGENNRVHPTEKEPVSMYFNDFDGNGKKEQVVSFYLGGREIPLASKMDLEKQMPFIKKKFLHAKNFSEASIRDIFTDDKINQSVTYTANYFSNACMINDGKGHFTLKALPWQAQVSCLKDAVIADVNGDQLPDIITGGNFYEQNMELNRCDASFGHVLINQGKGVFKAESMNGVIVKNEIRHILPIKIKGKVSYIIARNNDSVMIIQ